jgi:CheY-like chemotaxis protein
MQNGGPIIVIEDDIDDQDLLEETFKVLNYPNRVIFFSNGDDALTFMSKTKTKPLLILSDINLPKIDGFEIKKEINKKESLKHIPYLFFSSSAQEESIKIAYQVSAQGYFVKPDNTITLLNTIRAIVEYWQKCYLPKQLT